MSIFDTFYSFQTLMDTKYGARNVRKHIQFYATIALSFNMQIIIYKSDL